MAKDPLITPAFNGPVFIVGLPRSGTKLLRDLLNRNPRVSIPEVETHILPYLISKYGTPPSLHDQEQMERFGEDLRRSTFCGHMREQGIEVDLDHLASNADLGDWGSIFEVLLRYFGPKAETDGVIFGDKTPDYLRKMKLLRSTFPESRFVHIVRDPRDVALSAWRAWGQHPCRTAQRWQTALKEHRRVGETMGGYIEVRYEDLLADPSEVLESVCRFLDCDFVPEMLTLEKSTENRGDAKNAKAIMLGNTAKFWQGFRKSRIRRIEEIAFEQMVSLGYPLYLAEKPKSLGGTFGILLGASDLLATLCSKIRGRGLVRGTRYVMSQRQKRVRA